VNLSENLRQKGRVLLNEPLSKHTTLKIGGPVKIWAEAEDPDNLKGLLEISKTEGVPVFLIGSGSNILATDEGLDMMAISLKGLFGCCKAKEESVSAGAGCGLQGFILDTIKSGYSGLEFMAGIPGTVGGAIKMNAGSGARGPWISDFMKQVTVCDSYGDIRHIGKSDLRFEYRSSGLKELIILEAEFNLDKSEDAATVGAGYKKFLEEKKNKQELSVPSAGCVFKNPGGFTLSAAQMIEACGLKGKRLGDAVISGKHANFIVNSGKATFSDISGLIELIRREVLKKYNINLETEIEILENGR